MSTWVKYQVDHVKIRTDVGNTMLKHNGLIPCQCRPRYLGNNPWINILKLIDHTKYNSDAV